MAAPVQAFRHKHLLQNIWTNFIRHNSAGKKGKKAVLDLSKEVPLPVETDANKLATELCGSNLLVEGENVKLKPDSEYPDWLWKLHTGRPLELHEMDSNTLQYWNRVRAMGRKLDKELIAMRKDKRDYK